MPKPNLLVLDKELCYAEFLNIEPIILINKIDLSEKETEAIYEIYTKAGYKVIKTEAEKNYGLEELKKELKGNTSVLAGQSGVRKIYNNK